MLLCLSPHAAALGQYHDHSLKTSAAKCSVGHWSGPMEQFRGYEPLPAGEDDYSFLIIPGIQSWDSNWQPAHSLAQIEWSGPAVSKLLPQDNQYCLHKWLLLITKSLQPEADKKMNHRPNNKVCVEHKEQQTGLTVQWCEFNTAVTSVVCAC